MLSMTKGLASKRDDAHEVVDIQRGRRLPRNFDGAAGRRD